MAGAGRGRDPQFDWHRRAHGDLLGDPAYLGLSLAARGLWDLLACMAGREWGMDRAAGGRIRGGQGQWLDAEGAVMVLAGMGAGSREEVASAMDELAAAGFVSTRARGRKLRGSDRREPVVVMERWLGMQESQRPAAVRKRAERERAREAMEQAPAEARCDPGARQFDAPEIPEVAHGSAHGAVNGCAKDDCGCDVSADMSRDMSRTRAVRNRNRRTELSEFPKPKPESVNGGAHGAGSPPPPAPPPPASRGASVSVSAEGRDGSRNGVTHHGGKGSGGGAPSVSVSGPLRSGRAPREAGGGGAGGEWSNGAGGESRLVWDDPWQVDVHDRSVDPVELALTMCRERSARARNAWAKALRDVGEDVFRDLLAEFRAEVMRRATSRRIPPIERPGAYLASLVARRRDGGAP